MFISESYIDKLAHMSATSPYNNYREPTEKSKKAGNYKKGHLSFQGLPISIENPAGSSRSGTSEDGKTWKTKMHYHYGYIKKTESNDGDHIDVFIGNDHESDNVVIINQSNKDDTFDEHKVCIGFPNFIDAIKGYLKCYEKGWNSINSAHQVSMKDFKHWLKNSNTKQPYTG